MLKTSLKRRNLILTTFSQRKLSHTKQIFDLIGVTNPIASIFLIRISIGQYMFIRKRRLLSPDYYLCYFTFYLKKKQLHDSLFITVYLFFQYFSQAFTF